MRGKLITALVLASFLASTAMALDGNGPDRGSRPPMPPKHGDWRDDDGPGRHGRRGMDRWDDDRPGPRGFHDGMDRRGPGGMGCMCMPGKGMGGRGMGGHGMGMPGMGMGGHDMGMPGPGMGMGDDFGMGRLSRKLDLTKEQKTKLIDIRVNHFRATLEARQDLMEKRDELRSLRMKDDSPSDAIIRVNKEIGEIEGRLEALHRSLRTDLKNVLTDEQKQKMEQFRKDRFEDRDGGRGEGRRFRPGFDRDDDGPRGDRQPRHGKRDDRPGRRDRDAMDNMGDMGE